MNSRAKNMLRRQRDGAKKKALKEAAERGPAPDHIQRLKPIKMEGKAAFVHPRDLPTDSPGYQRWAAENPEEAADDGNV